MSKTAATAFLNGEFVELANARVSVLDQGLLRGDGLFETIRIRRGKIPLLQENLERLYESAKWVGLSVPIPREKLTLSLNELVRRNRIVDGRLRVVFTRGVGKSFDPIGQDTEPTFFALVEELGDRPNENDYERGVAVVTVPVAVFNGLFPSPVKSTSYFPNMAAKRKAREQSAFEALFVDGHGEISEGSTSNIFWVREGEVYTTPLVAGALPGVTRKTLKLLLKRRGKDLQEERLRAESLLRVDEAFLTGSIVGVLGIATVDGKKLSTGCGPLTKELRATLEKYLDELSR